MNPSDVIHLERREVENLVASIERAEEIFVSLQEADLAFVKAVLKESLGERT